MLYMYMYVDSLEANDVIFWILVTWMCLTLSMENNFLCVDRCELWTYDGWIGINSDAVLIITWSINLSFACATSDIMVIIWVLSLTISG